MYQPTPNEIRKEVMFTAGVELEDMLRVLFNAYSGPRHEQHAVFVHDVEGVLRASLLMEEKRTLVT